MSSSARSWLVALSVLSIAWPAASLTIDNFEEGNFTVSDNTSTFGATFGEQSGLSSANALGGVRLVRAFAAGVGTHTATTTLTTTPAPDDGALLSYLGNGGSGQFAFIYDGIANGLEDGTSGALGLDLSAFSAIQIDVVANQAGSIAQVELSSSTQQTSSGVALANGATLIPLSVFNLVDLSDIRAIRISIQGIDAIDAMLVTNIQAVAVPEASTALLLGVGLVGLAIWRKR